MLLTRTESDELSRALGLDVKTGNLDALVSEIARLTAKLGKMERLWEQHWEKVATKPGARRMCMSLSSMPARRFVKEMIRVGAYVHPTEGYKFSMDQARLHRLAAAFKAMQSNGVDVEVVKDHSTKAEDVVGYLSSVYVEGDKLMGVHDMIGEDAIRLAETVRNVSLAIEPDYVDGRGQHYGEAIVHSAVVQRPVVQGQTPFKIAASAANAQGSRLHLSTDNIVNPSTDDDDRAYIRVRQRRAASYAGWKT